MSKDFKIDWDAFVDVKGHRYVKLELYDKNVKMLYERIDKAIAYLKGDTIKYPTDKVWREHLIKILKGEE